MRLLVSCVVVFSTSVVHAERASDADRGYVAARVAMQYTDVDKDDGAPKAWGPRAELTGGLHATLWLSFAGVLAISKYSDTVGDFDGPYSIDVRDIWTGVRIVLHPHARVFTGLGVMRLFTTEHTNRWPEVSFQSTTGELFAGVNVWSTDQWRWQVFATAGTYDRFGDLEHVVFLSIGVGAHLRL